MIWYGKSLAGRLRVLFRLYGSAFPRSLLISAASALLTWVLHTYAFDWIHGNYDTQVSYQAFAFILGVVIVFRTNASYQRYTAARDHTQQLSANLADGCSQLLAFEYGTRGPGAPSDSAAEADIATFAEQLLHLASLMHALALQHLRRDWDLGNLCRHVRGVPPPPENVDGRAGFRLSDLWSLRCTSAQRAEYNVSMPLPVLGGLGSAELRALGMKAAEGSQHPSTRNTPRASLGVKNAEDDLEESLTFGPVTLPGRPHAGPNSRTLPKAGALGAGNRVGLQGLVSSANVLPSIYSGVEGASATLRGPGQTDGQTVQEGSVQGASRRSAFADISVQNQPMAATATNTAATGADAGAAATADTAPQASGALFLSGVFSSFRRSAETTTGVLNQPLLTSEDKRSSTGSEGRNGGWERVDAQDSATENTDGQRANAATGHVSGSGETRTGGVQWPDVVDDASKSAKSGVQLRGIVQEVLREGPLGGAVEGAGRGGVRGGSGSYGGRVDVLALGLGTTGWGYLPGPAEAVNVVHTWMYQLTTRRKYQEGGLRVDAPVLAQAYAALGRAYAAFEECRTLVETPFPWPWAQVMLVLLIFYCFSLPFIVVSHIGSTTIAVIADFLAVSTYWTIDEVARDLEDAFSYEPNSHPLSLIQYQLNERLLQAAAASRGGIPLHLGGPIVHPIDDEELGLQQGDDWARSGELPIDTRQSSRILKQVAACFARTPSAIDL